MMLLDIATAKESEKVISFDNKNKGYFSNVQEAIREYEKKYANLLSINQSLTRKLVSFQSNKNTPIHRLFKYKEGFSATLIEYFIDELKAEGPILDPFSGAGTTGIIASSQDFSFTGIELLPISHLTAEAKFLISKGITKQTMQIICKWKTEKPWKQELQPKKLNSLRITDNAYPPETQIEIEQFLFSCKKEKGEVKKILMFALLCILENISYTSKDGQCLRWDKKSGRALGKTTFEKNNILSFDQAIVAKLDDILRDADENKLIPCSEYKKNIVEPNFILGSALTELPKLCDEKFRSIITSPPYCNRYDYTRIYALELAALGITEENIRTLRKKMLSCTVENQQKNLLYINPNWEKNIKYTQEHEILKLLLGHLNELKKNGKLNNNGIPRMIEGYFAELSCIIYECYRLLEKDGTMIMVNDNVQYAGIAIPVDMILSDIARNCGFKIDEIMVLPSSKGNSSQQMGRHGRNPIRKCVYRWRK